MNSEIKRNFLYAFIAQGISLIVSSLTNLLLPKYVSVLNFSYWQLFIFYGSYITCLSLGLNDGVYLRYGGLREDNLDRVSIKSQYVFGILFQVILGILIGFVWIACEKSVERRLIIVLVIVYFFIYTFQSYLSFIFQAINQTNVFSKSTILQRIIFLVFFFLCLVRNDNNIYEYIIIYIFALACALFYLTLKINHIFSKAEINLILGFKQAIKSMKLGISLMFANICSMLILGVGRQIIDVRWGIVAFGKISFSLTLMNFFLTFIMQVGLVLFPALRRLDRKKLKKNYILYNTLLYRLLPLIYIGYLPISFVLKIWLPQYTSSIYYLSIILPICFFDSKMELVGNTFFKVLNKQVMLLKINVITIILSVALGLIGAYLVKNMDFVILGLVVAIIFRSLFANYVLSSDLGVSLLRIDILDILLAAIFIISTNLLTWWLSLIILIISYLCRLFVLKKQKLKM